MLEKHGFGLTSVDDLKVGALISDQRFQVIIISNQGKYIFAISTKMLRNIFFRTCVLKF